MVLLNYFYSFLKGKCSHVRLFNSTPVELPPFPSGFRILFSVVTREINLNLKQTERVGDCVLCSVVNAVFLSPHPPVCCVRDLSQPVTLVSDGKNYFALYIFLISC